MDSLNTLETQSIESKKCELLNSVKYETENFRNSILHVSENVGEKLFAEIFNLEVDSLTNKIKMKIDRFVGHQESFTEENLTPPENGNDDLEKAECLIKLQTLFSMITNHLSKIDNE